MRIKQKVMNKETKKKVAIIGTVGLPAKYGGFETLVNHLVQNMDQEKYEITVYCTKTKYKKEERISTFKGALLKYMPFDANGIQSIPYDTISIIHAALKSDVLLILGVAGAWILPFVRWFTNKKIVISIDGIEWRREKWNMLARWYLLWAEGIAVKYSHIDISDNESIQNYTAARYGTLSRVVEYGADHVNRLKLTEEVKNQYPVLRSPYALKVCRVEPENNVHNVLKAFSLMPKRNLVIIGNWDNSFYGKKLRRKYKMYSNIHMLDPIYDQNILDQFRTNAYLYIHGHSAGGTNPALVEAMYLGLPIITFGVSYNKTTTEGKALYFYDAESLKQIIESATLPSLKELGQVMFKIASRRYVWDKIAIKYQDLVADALIKKPKLSKKSRYAELKPEILEKFNAAHLASTYHFYEKR